MRTLLIRGVFVFTLLLALGAAFGVANATSAHAATLSVAHTASLAEAAKPALNPVGCASNVVQFYSSAGEWCFANAGYTSSVTIPYLYEACGGDYNVAVGTNQGITFVPRGVCQIFLGGVDSPVTLVAFNIY